MSEQNCEKNYIFIEKMAVLINLSSKTLQQEKNR